MKHYSTQLSVSTPHSNASAIETIQKSLDEAKQHASTCRADYDTAAKKEAFMKGLVESNDAYGLLSASGVEVAKELFPTLHDVNQLALNQHCTILLPDTYGDVVFKGMLSGLLGR